MIKQAELQQAYLLGRQAAMEKVANVSVTETNNMNNLSLALGGGALAYQGARSPAIMNALQAADLQASIGLNNLGLRKLPETLASAQGFFRDVHKARALSALKASPLKSLAGLGAVGLGTYGAYKGLSHLLGND
jgi:hypothetical protein